MTIEQEAIYNGYKGHFKTTIEFKMMRQLSDKEAKKIRRLLTAIIHVIE